MRWPEALAGTAVLVLLSGCTSSEPERPVVESAVVTDAGYLTATGHISGVAEDGGTCRFTFWYSSGAASRLTSRGEIDGDRTSCVAVSEQTFQLPAGDYSLSLSYVSPDGELLDTTSERVDVSVP